MTDSISSLPRVWTLDDLFAQPDPLWIVEGVIPEGGEGMIYGATGTGKTFVALDLALTIATGLPDWFGRKVRGGPVVYVAGEGAWGLKNRVAAWKRMHPDADPGFLVVPDGIQLMSAENTGDLIAAVEKIAPDMDLSVVVFDTLSRVTAGADEDARKDMGLAFDNAAAVRRRFNCSTCFVHHSGHDGRRARGSSSILQVMDWAIRAEMTDGNRSLKCEKMRDAAPFDPIGFKLTVRPPSMIVEPTDAMDAPLTPDQEKALDVLRRACGPVSWTYWKSEAGLKKATFGRVLNELKARGTVSETNQGYLVSGLRSVSEGPIRPGVVGLNSPHLLEMGLGTNPETGTGDLEDEAIEREAIVGEPV